MTSTNLNVLIGIASGILIIYSASETLRKNKDSHTKLWLSGYVLIAIMIGGFSVWNISVTDNETEILQSNADSTRKSDKNEIIDSVQSAWQRERNDIIDSIKSHPFIKNDYHNTFPTTKIIDSEKVLHPDLNIVRQIEDSARRINVLIALKYDQSNAIKNRQYTIELQKFLVADGYTNATLFDAAVISGSSVGVNIAKAAASVSVIVHVY